MVRVRVEEGLTSKSGGIMSGIFFTGIMSGIFFTGIMSGIFFTKST